MTDDPVADRAIQRAAAFCRLYMLEDTAGRGAILEIVNAEDASALVGFVESLAGLATEVDRVGRGRQVVKTRKQLLAYFEDMAAVAYRGAA